MVAVIVYASIIAAILFISKVISFFSRKNDHNPPKHRRTTSRIDEAKLQTTILGKLTTT